MRQILPQFKALCQEWPKKVLQYLSPQSVEYQDQLEAEPLFPVAVEQLELHRQVDRHLTNVYLIEGRSVPQQSITQHRSHLKAFLLADGIHSKTTYRPVDIPMIVLSKHVTSEIRIVLSFRY